MERTLHRIRGRFRASSVIGGGSAGDGPAIGYISEGTGTEAWERIDACEASRPIESNRSRPERSNAMLWRHLGLVRAWSAAGLLTSTMLGAALMAPARAEPDKSPSGPAVSILKAEKAGDLKLDVRGAGQEKVRLNLTNKSANVLRVVLPAGLVASSVPAQPPGGGGGRGGFQSMGLGAVGNRPGSFGEFARKDADAPGFRSVALSNPEIDKVVTVPVGEAVELTLPGVCLNFGIRTPNIRDKFQLVDVDDYSGDPRVRKALRSLATYGTSHGVAQATMWRVCNDLPFEAMLEQASKLMNPHEIAIAARFVNALDASGSSELVDPAYLTEGRLFVRVTGDASAAKDAERLARELDGLRVLGMPVRVVRENDSPNGVASPALLLNVALMAGKNGETRGRVVLYEANFDGEWAAVGKTYFDDNATTAMLEGAGLARAIDHAVASSFVSVKVANKNGDTTTLVIQNRLPMTLTGLSLKSGDSAGAARFPFTALGLAPGRSAKLTVPAGSAIADHVELNGL